MRVLARAKQAIMLENAPLEYNANSGAGSLYLLARLYRSRRDLWYRCLLAEETQLIPRRLGRGLQLQGVR